MLNMSACWPSPTVSTLTPARSSRLAVTALPPNTPIDPVSVPGWATMASAGGGDEVAAGGGHVRHGHHDRRAGLAGADHLPPDGVRGDGGTARAVHPQHDRAGPVVGGGGPQCRSNRVRPHRAVARAAPAAATPDRAGRVDKGDHVLGWPGQLARPPGERARALVAAEVEQERAWPHGLARVGIDLVPVAERIHQPGGQRLAGHERAAVDERPGLALAGPQALRDRLGQLPGEGGHECLHRLPGRPGEAVLGEPVRRVLVFVPLHHLDVQAELVERAAEEQLPHADPGKAEIPGGLEVDLAERGRQVVRQIAARHFTERLRPRHRRLSRGGEVGDGGPQVLDPPHPDGPPADLDHQRLHPVIGARPAQPVQHIGEPGPAHGQERGEGIGGWLLGEAFGQVEFQDQRGGPALDHPVDLVLKHGPVHVFHPRACRGGPGRPGSGLPRRPGLPGRAPACAIVG